MKSFDEFLSTLDTDALTQKTLSGINSSNITYSEKELRLAVSISKAIGASTQELLRQYHEWLQK